MRVNRATTKPRLRDRLRREEDGVAMVELVIVAPVLLAILFGILYFGRFMNYASAETHLAAEAARWAAVNVNPGSGTLQSYVLAQAPAELQNGSTDVPTPAQVYIYYPSGSSGASGQAVRACVTATIHFIPILGLANQTITETATMRLEQTPSTWTADSSPPAACPTT
jgi:Flp pilus assembly protein TadG